MTNADYVAIAVSPALVMALIGSLVFFLIEVLYAGDYMFRLNYLFALFVFATVLIARIAIEIGSERAMMYSLPLGLVCFVALQRFIQHPSSLSWLINATLLALVWWCAHKLTWDCTLIDDNEDASGEGLLGQVGLDAHDETASTPATTGNELFAEGDKSGAQKVPWWRRLFVARKGPHTPGVWVLYFSLAALPLFGIGQHWIPAGDVARRRYAFGLLAVYVAAALCLLVTTSFLGLRRYLRQRRVEMPAPMAATWVSLGAVLILLVMFTAALIPRPGAEYSISQAPWQAISPSDQSSSRYAVGNEGTDDPNAESRVTSDNADAPLGDDTGGDQDSAPSGESAKGKQSQPGEGKQQDSVGGANESQDAESGDESKGKNKSEPSNESSDTQSAEGRPAESSDSSQSDAQAEQGRAPEEASSGAGASEQQDSPDEGSSMSKAFEHANSANPAQMLQSLSLSIGNALKLLFYAILAAVIAVLAWKNREAIARGLSEIIRQLREFLARLFGGGAAATAADADGHSTTAPRRRTFAEFKDPFAGGRHQQIAPVELVRYTFEAFEAWAGDRGRPRTPDQTPQEMVRSALAPQTPMYAQARQMVQLYSEAAYASATISRESAASLQSLWQMMRANQPPIRTVDPFELSSTNP
jgi:hypothetical protein